MAGNHRFAIRIMAADGPLAMADEAKSTRGARTGG
jgi:hypothetical protein